MPENVHAHPERDEGLSAGGADLVEASDVDIRRAVVSGGRWGVLSGVAEQVVGAAVTAIVARVLIPSELGLVAAATVIVGMFALLTRVGVMPGLVRRPSLDATAASSAFWGAAILGLIGTGLAAGTAKWTTAAIGTPQASGILAALSAMILLGLLANVVQGVALRSLRFRAVYGSDVVAAATYAGTTLIAAALGMGAWAIVVGRLASGATRLVALMVMAGWRPTAVFDLSTLRGEHARFNGIVLGSQMTGFASKNMDYWVVGRAFFPAALGIYYIAYVVPTILRQRMTWLANELLFPTLVRLRDRGENAVGAHAEAMRLLVFVAMPALVGLALVSHDVVVLAFGERWSAAGGPMAVLALSAAVEIVTQVDTTLFLAIGKAGRSIVVNVVRLVVLAALLPVALAAGGLTAIALAVLASTVVAQGAAQVYLSRDFCISASGVLRLLAPAGVPTAVMAAAVGLLLHAVGGSSPILRVVVATVAGAGVFFGAALTLYRRETVGSLRQLRHFAFGSGGGR